MQLIGLLLNLAAITATTLANVDDIITLSPPEETLVRYTNESLIVQCYGLTTKAKLHWKSPKGEIVKDHRGRIHIEESAPEQLKLVFTHISLADKGDWTCEDTSTDVKANRAFNLIVYQKITFTENTTILTVKEAETATILCEVKGEPLPNVTWNFNGEPITTDSNTTKFRILADGLLINNVTQNDTGEYTCRAYQVNTIASDMQERTVRLKIEHKPFWVQHKHSTELRYAYLTGFAEINCEAIAEPPANFTWYRDNKAIQNNTYYTITTDNYISTLLIRAKDKSVFVTYKCRAKNNLGNIERFTKLEEGVKPPPPTTLQLRGFNSNRFDVDLGVASNNSGPKHMNLNGFRIEYMTEYEFKADAGKWTNAKRSDFQYEDGVTFLISELEPNTTYLLRAATKNPAGLSDWTRVEKFRTLSNTPPSTGAIMNVLPRTHILCIALVALLLGKELSFGFPDVGKITKVEKIIGMHI